MDHNDRFQTPEEELKLKVSDTEIKEAVSDSADIVEVMPEFDLPKEFDGYEIEHLINKGASGFVFKAKKFSTDTAVAIKVFKKELIPDKEALKRFQKEIEILESLLHPNIVSVLGFGTAPSGAPYMVMEYIEGESMRDRLDSGNVFQPKTMASIMREVCRALTYSHSQSIIHRDLKPSNIIVNEQNIAKVVDFGVAKAIDYSDETITQLGAFVGTPHYVSPEQCLGKPVDGRSDIYSLGCTMFEMLTGIKALDASTPVEAIAKLMAEDRSYLKKTLETDVIPQEIKEIILKCLNHDPAKRYQSIAELDHDLGAFLLERPLAYAKSTGHSKDRRPLLLVATAIIGCLAVFLAVSPWSNFFRDNHNNPAPITKVPVVPVVPPVTNAFGGNRFVIKNRHTGKIIFADVARDMKTALQHAADKKVSLHEADLRGARLIQAKLSGLDLSGADLSGARMTQAKLTDMNFQGAQMIKVDLTQAELTDCNFFQADLNEARLVQVKAPSGNFKAANLSKADLTQAKMERANFIRARFNGTRAGQAHFENADMREADFKDAHLTQAQFDNADVREAKFDGAGIIQTDFSNARQY